MDGFNEKKWFVYLADHHEGPFSLDEIETKIRGHEVTTSNFIWCEGMADWKSMTELTEFAPMLSGLANHSPPPPPTLAGGEISLEIPLERSPEPPVLVKIEPVAIQPDPATSIEEEEQTAIRTYEQASPPAKTASRKGLMVAALIFIAVIGAYWGGFLKPISESPFMRAVSEASGETLRPHVLKLSKFAPFLSKWISPIPSIAGVSEEDFDSLKAAASAPLALGPRVAVALVQTDLLIPTFHAATNLPDGTELELHVLGLSGTLLNHIDFSQVMTGQVSKNLAHFDRVQFSDGRPLARGEYDVYAVNSDKQLVEVQTLLDLAQATLLEMAASIPAGRKVATKKSYFLGGPKDESYTTRLKEFHGKLRVKAEEEMKELKQFATTLEAQINSSNTTFTRIRGKARRTTKQQQSQWHSFHDQWTALNSQMTESFGRWTDSIAKNEYFYGTLYKLVQEVGNSAAKLHAYQHNYFAGAVDAESFDVQLGESASSTETSLAQLKIKIEKAESLPTAPSGMPQREGQ